MAATIDEISFDLEQEGKQVRKELKREVLTKGSWTTIMFLFQDLNRKTEEFGPPKVAITRFKKWKGVYRKQSGFNISSEKQARAIISTLEKWFDDPAMAGAEGDDDEDAGDEE